MLIVVVFGEDFVGLWCWQRNRWTCGSGGGVEGIVVLEGGLEGIVAPAMGPKAPANRPAAPAACPLALALSTVLGLTMPGRVCIP